MKTFLQQFHRRPFRSVGEVMKYDGVIDDQIDFIDCTGTRYNVTPLIIASGKGSFEKTKILLVHGANPNIQCSTGLVNRIFRYFQDIAQRIFFKNIDSIQFSIDKLLFYIDIIQFDCFLFLSDTALNLAVHRQKYHIVDLLLKYRANPNIPNQAGKTALHRAVSSYVDENANHIRALLEVSKHVFVSLTNFYEIEFIILMIKKIRMNSKWKSTWLNFVG